MEMGGDSSLFQPETLRHLVETMIFNQLGIKIYIYIYVFYMTLILANMEIQTLGI